MKRCWIGLSSQPIGLPDAESAGPGAVHLIDDAELNHAPGLRARRHPAHAGAWLQPVHTQRSPARLIRPRRRAALREFSQPSGAGRTLSPPRRRHSAKRSVLRLRFVESGATRGPRIGLVSPGGGAGLFGNVALAGTIFPHVQTDGCRPRLWRKERSATPGVA